MRNLAGLTEGEDSLADFLGQSLILRNPVLHTNFWPSPFFFRYLLLRSLHFFGIMGDPQSSVASTEGCFSAEQSSVDPLSDY